VPIKSRIRSIYDYPKKGIIFRDITTLLQDAVGFRLVIDQLTDRYKDSVDDIDAIVGVEARGFILGAALAYTLGKGFVPIRKAGKLPHDTIGQEYELEYGTDTVEIHKDSLNEGDNVLLVDDLLATGGTTLASAMLVEKLGATVHELAFIVNLPALQGEQRLLDKGYKVFSLTEFEGE